MSDATATKQKFKKYKALAPVGAKGGKIVVKLKGVPMVGGRFGSGLVTYFVDGPAGKIRVRDFTPSSVVEVLRGGLPLKELAVLQAGLDVPAEKLAPMLGISKATLHRIKGAGKRLGPAESDRVVRFARLLGRAIKVFGGKEDARQWLGSAQFGLGGAVPLDYARSEAGAREVENLLGRIEYGVYS